MEQIIQDTLKKLKTREDLLSLFREKLGFHPPQIPTIPCDIKIAEIDHAETIAEFGPIEIYYIHLRDCFDDTFQSERHLRKIERDVIKEFSSAYRRQKVFVFSDAKREYWDFVYPADYERRLVLKRFTIRSDNRDKLRTAATQLAHLIAEPEEDLYEKIEDAFSVSEVSERFFEEFTEVFKEVKKELLKQSKFVEKVHRFTHQLFNRLMFLYFMQRRGVFGGNKNFLATLWNSYRNNYEGKDEFYDKWLKILFFKALNNKFQHKEYLKISEELNFNTYLAAAPFLNGGLFKEDLEIDYLDLKLKDKLFVKIFDFLESYNFTVRESTPLDEDLEIDPEMLGNIYEMSVNVSESEEDERHKSGIFYTPRIEIEFMLRRSIVEFLYNKTQIDKLKLYEFVFPEMDEQKIPKFSIVDAKRLYDVLDSITIIDPACGSGHYLIVAVQILYEFKKELWRQLGNSEESFEGFEQKVKIIESSIFGVDIKKWATEIAKLRLWLELIVDAKDEQLYQHEKALLPSLSFKIRVGDSLVQEIGGIFFSPREIKGIPSSLVALKNEVIKSKTDFFYGRDDVEEDEVKKKELSFFKEILKTRVIAIRKEIEKLENPKGEKSKQIVLFEEEDASEQLEMDLSKLNERRINQLKEELQRLEEEKENLSMKSEFAFWPIEFAEIFSGDNGQGGFDIVIANPPYVRQELISDPKKEKSSVADNKKYKEKLSEQIKKDWNDRKGRLINLDKRSDLYVYFYLKGLQLLNSDGVMCYISSNSWLDVGYGAGLQEILLKRVPIVAIYDNQKKRSFKHADVNTIIAVLGRPKLKDWTEELKNNKVRFVMFKKLFEEAIFTEVLWQIETNTDPIIKNDYFRLVQKAQWDLYEEGIEEKLEENQQRLAKTVFVGDYSGNKWGGKYLRAPDIFFTILQLGKNKLVNLGKFSKVIPGCYSGINDFFYLNSEHAKALKIDKQFLLPLIRSSSDISCLKINSIEKYYVLSVPQIEKEKLPKGILEYVLWGEKQKTRKRQKTVAGIPWPKTETVKSRKYWYSIPENNLVKTRLFMQYVANDRFYCPYSDHEAISDRCFHRILLEDKDLTNRLAAILNSTIQIFFVMLLGRSGLGQGALKFEAKDANNVYTLNPAAINISEQNFIECIEKIGKRKPLSIFEECGIDPQRSIRDQEPNPLPDRKELDDIIFDILGLTKEERKEVYWAVCELVKNRLEKARSV